MCAFKSKIKFKSVVYKISLGIQKHIFFRLTHIIYMAYAITVINNFLELMNKFFKCLTPHNELFQGSFYCIMINGVLVGKKELWRI